MKAVITDAPYCTWIRIVDQVDRSVQVFKKITCISRINPDDLCSSFS